MKKSQELELEGERKKYEGGNFLRCGAKDGTRTHTLSLAADFESAASTNSATLAYGCTLY